ncbi:MAG: protein translocase subunit SecF [Candidatus Berkelbacteria bacterium]|nr:protein translocase subunit SecF [Candidatus Berkelbacteria bacterium]
MYRIIKNSWIWFTFSITLAVISIIAICVFGLRIGIDYKGGTSIEFTAASADRVNLAKSVLDDSKYNGYQIKESGNNSVIIKMPTLSNDQHKDLNTKMTALMPDYNETQYDTVGPIIGQDLTNKSIFAVILASLGIIIFVAFAFRKVPKPLSSWKFGMCAVIALIHDLLITTGFVAILGHFFIWMEVDALFITALLTIMGFSVHDTIVVYDRLRENFIKNPHQDIEISAEESINQTIVRSINTSMTTVLVLIALLIFGSSSIRHFIITLVFGILIGTYSSIFNATPLLVLWQKKSWKKSPSR